MSGIDQFLKKAEGTTVLVVGDVMVDAYLWGRVDRISPEAPVPVVQVTHRSARLGGAANVALNVKALGGRAIIAAVVGADDHADLLNRLFAEQELVPDGLVRSPLRRTTVKTRVISGHQHVVRVDEEQEDDLVADDEERLLERIALVLHNDRPGVIVLEDYNKGVLTARVIEGIVELARKAKVPVAVDPKRKNFLAYRGVTLFKPNLKELREGLKTEVDPSDAGSVARAIKLLEERLGNAISLVTLSEHGAHVHDAHGGSTIPAHKRRIVDVSGAGDTVIAVAALALAQQLPARSIAELANLAGGLVCEEVGVVPLDKERFRAECERLHLPA
ncbi:MAG: D-glycero-beta-D-manno-heptose-7-phosphate kinase [Flavobacteriales bacterium]|nr:D-glycero-beta-D-manno-heptose-7-phosphate kinase [Flavobacteriales bacterium]